MSPSARIPASGKLGYAVGIYGVWLAWMMVALYLLYFYTDVLGLSPAAAGLVFFVASLWDAASDVLMGWLIDRTRTRWGRYRPYLLLAAVPFAASFAALFYDPGLEGTSLFVWALVLHVVFRTAYTAVYIPYTAFIARLTPDADERASVAGYKSVFVSLGALTVSFLGLPAVTLLGGEDEARGFLRFALICAALGVATLWICFLATREPDELASGDGPSVPSVSLAEMWRALRCNGAVQLVFLGVILFTGCYTILNKAIVYFFKYDLGDRDAASWALSAIALAGILSPLIWVRWTHRTSKRATWIFGCLLAAVCLATIGLYEVRSIPLLVALLFLAGCGIHAFLMTFFAMVADAADYGEWKSGVRLEAPLFGLVSLANKTSLAVGTWGLTLMLEAVGFVPNAPQSPETLDGILAIMTFVPPVGFLLSAAVISFFPVSTARHREIAAELILRRGADTRAARTATGAAGPAR